MNDQSLRYEDNQNISAEAKLAKVRQKKKYIKIINILGLGKSSRRFSVVSHRILLKKNIMLNIIEE